MLVMHYAHRLPADYPMETIRARIAARGPQWESIAGLGFKAVVVGERGRYGAVGKTYASFYLWLSAEAAHDFLIGERFAAVIETFGRPSVETLVPLVVRSGPTAEEARVLTRSDTPVSPNADLDALRADETELAETIAATPGTAAVVVALDPSTWRLTRLVLAREPTMERAAVAFEIARLSHPGWAHLRHRS